LLLYKTSKSFNNNLKISFLNKLVFFKNVKNVYSNVTIYSTKYQLTISQLIVNLCRYPLFAPLHYSSKVLTLAHLHFIYKKCILNHVIDIITRLSNSTYILRNSHVNDKSYNKVILLL